MQWLCPNVLDPADTEEYLSKSLILSMATTSDMLFRFALVLLILYFLAACEEALCTIRSLAVAEKILETHAANPQETPNREKRSVPEIAAENNTAICGATALRMNLDLKRVSSIFNVLFLFNHTEQYLVNPLQSLDLWGLVSSGSVRNGLPTLGDFFVWIPKNEYDDLCYLSHYATEPRRRRI